ncbi:MAG: tol-pal system-associated acyl-CoA thioesterase [Proteobacteria bacterium]|nr:tol-pal system-associated acyl-CoA thioesterase [Pseudomonadota bacterium]
MSTQQKEFSWPVRVYYEDTDSGGVVYYANYLKFMERARTELLRSIGYEQDQLQQELGILFAVHNANIQYIKPARFNDELKVLTSITSLGRASIQFKQSIMLVSSSYLESSLDTDAGNAVLLSSAEIKIACLNAEKFTPQSIPASIIEKINMEFYRGS